MESPEAAWQAYKEAVAGGKNPQEAYRELVWPLLLARWRHNPPVYPEPQSFDLSIHTLGTTPEATALAILGTRARETYVFHTPETRPLLPRLREDTGVEVYPLEIGKSEAASIYQKVRELLEKHPGARVALDVTGGTKAMSAGLAAAGFFFQRFFPGVRVVYVDNETYDPILRRPIAGSERLILLPNPHEVLGEVDGLLARELYEKRDFRGAADFFQRMAQKTGSEGDRLYALLAQMYHAWRSLDFEAGAKAGKSMLQSLEKEAHHNHPLRPHLPRLRRQVETLQRAQAFLSTGAFGEQAGVLAVGATLLGLAEEYGRRGQAVLAALHAYRGLELLLQERMARQERRAEDPRLTPEEAERLRAELAALLDLPLEKVRLGPKLGLLDLIAFLRLLGDEALRARPPEELRGLAGALQARNESLLVHGLRVPTEKEMEGVRRLARALLDALRQELGQGVELDPVPLK